MASSIENKSVGGNESMDSKEFPTNSDEETATNHQDMPKSPSNSSAHFDISILHEETPNLILSCSTSDGEITTILSEDSSIEKQSSEQHHVLIEVRINMISN